MTRLETLQAALQDVLGSKLKKIVVDRGEITITDWLVFGAETTGLPPAIRDAFPDEQRVRLPMRAGQRSLNLSNAVAVAVFEAWRQNGYAGGS